MPPRRRTTDPFEALSAFGQRLTQAAHKPTINRYQPMPAQDIFHQMQVKHRVATGGNRSGKTFSTIADDVLVMLHRHPHRQHLYPDRPLVGRFIGVDFERGIDQGAVPIFQQFLPPSALINGSWEDSYRKGEHVLHLADGGRISFMSYEQDPDKFQIVSLDWVHFDEEPPVPIFKESQLRLIDSGGCWTISMTPVQQMEWLQDEIIDPVRDGTRTDVGVVELDTEKNIHLSAEAVRELGEGLSDEEKAVRFRGQYLSGSLVFGEFTRKYPFVIPADFTPWPHQGWQIFESMDYGYANPTAWIWTAVHPDGSIVTFDIDYAPQVTIKEWAERVKAKRAEIGARLGLGGPLTPVLTVGDPSIAQRNSGQTGITNQEAYALEGIYIATDGIVSARSGNQGVGLDKMHTYLRLRPAAAGRAASNGELEMPWWQITENCEPLIWEMRRARKPRQTLKQQEVKNSSEQIRDKDNHAIDAQKYLFIVTHELRPERFASSSGGTGSALEGFQQATGVTVNPFAPETHREAYATISADRRIEPGSYRSLEG